MMTAFFESLWPLLAWPLAARASETRPGAAGDESSDQQLVDRARRGDPRAMQQIYQRHADRVYRRLTRLVGPVPEREDLLQEVFIALFQGLGSYRGDASLSTFLYRIASNKACDHLKRRARRASATPLSEAAGEMECPSPSPEQQARSSQQADLFWQCLDRLKPQKRVALVLRVVEGLSLNQISDQVGASVFAVAQRIRHAKKELQQMVQQHEKELQEGGR